MRVKLNAQLFQVLLMLLEQPGQLGSRNEISRVLCPEGTSVDNEQGANSAVDRICDALFLQRIACRPQCKLQRFPRHAP